MDSLKCTFAKVEGAFGFENDENIYSELNISVTFDVDTRPDNINQGDVYRVVSLEEDNLDIQKGFMVSVSARASIGYNYS